jgi:hypothetical protein
VSIIRSYAATQAGMHMSGLAFHWITSSACGKFGSLAQRLIIVIS